MHTRLEEERRKHAAALPMAVQRTIGRWMNQRLSAAFARWKEFTSQVQRTQRLLERSAHRMKHREIFMAVDALRWTMKEARRRRYARSKALGMWKNRVAGAAFLRWHERTCDARTQRVAVQRTIGRWMNQRLSAAFIRWGGFTSQVKIERVAVHRMMGRRMNQRRSAAFARWTEFIREAWRSKAVREGKKVGEAEARDLRLRLDEVRRELAAAVLLIDDERNAALRRMLARQQEFDGVSLHIAIRQSESEREAREGTLRRVAKGAQSAYCQPGQDLSHIECLSSDSAIQGRRG